MYTMHIKAFFLNILLNVFLQYNFDIEKKDILLRLFIFSSVPRIEQTQFKYPSFT